MQVELFVADQCPACDRAVAIWQDACRRCDARFETVNVNQPDGKARLAALRLGTVPALVIDGELMAVGVQTAGQAQELIAIAAAR